MQMKGAFAAFLARKQKEMEEQQKLIGEQEMSNAYAPVNSSDRFMMQ
jgi:hypothetical protein